jgi:hypothetical protein
VITGLGVPLASRHRWSVTSRDLPETPR